MFVKSLVFCKKGVRIYLNYFVSGSKQIKINVCQRSARRVNKLKIVCVRVGEVKRGKVFGVIWAGVCQKRFFVFAFFGQKVNPNTNCFIISELCERLNLYITIETWRSNKKCECFNICIQNVSTHKISFSWWAFLPLLNIQKKWFHHKMPPANGMI